MPSACVRKCALVVFRESSNNVRCVMGVVGVRSRNYENSKAGSRSDQTLNGGSLIRRTLRVRRNLLDVFGSGWLPLQPGPRRPADPPACEPGKRVLSQVHFAGSTCYLQNAHRNRLSSMCQSTSQARSVTSPLLIFLCGGGIHMS
ncbi:unnamed protein product [Amoebophrya sp. A25]|nr:unnamed protein product [Amoebophrya sp. A25]|eukprot:GSA25T00010402001.1